MDALSSFIVQASSAGVRSVPNSGSTTSATNIPPAINNMPNGAIVKGTVSQSTAHGEVSLTTKQGELVLKTNIFMKQGMEVAIKLEKSTGELFAKLISIDGQSVAKYVESTQAQHPKGDVLMNANMSANKGTQQFTSDTPLRAITLGTPSLSPEALAKLPPQIATLLSKAQIGTQLTVTMRSMQLPTVGTPVASQTPSTVPSQNTAPATTAPQSAATPASSNASGTTTASSLNAQGTVEQTAQSGSSASQSTAQTAKADAPTQQTQSATQTTATSTTQQTPQQATPQQATQPSANAQPQATQQTATTASQPQATTSNALQQTTTNLPASTNVPNTNSATPTPATATTNTPTIATTATPLSATAVTNAATTVQTTVQTATTQQTQTTSQTQPPAPTAQAQAGQAAQPSQAATQTSTPTPPSQPAMQAPTTTPPSPATTPPASSAPLSGTVIGSTSNAVLTLQSDIGSIRLFSPTTLPTGTQILFDISTITPQTAATAALGKATAPTVDFEGMQAIAQLTHAATSATTNAHLVPHTGKGLTTELVFFIAALKGGDMKKWIDDKHQVQIESLKGDILSKVTSEFNNLRGGMVERQEPEQWNSLTLPIAHEEQVNPIALHYRQDERENDDKNSEDTNHFIVDLSLSNIGPLQLDGFVTRVKGQQSITFDLAVRSDDKLTDEVEQGIREIYQDAQEITGFKGQIRFRSGFQARRIITDTPPPPPITGFDAGSILA